ncbi:hypothetical protein EC973_004047 [Apophysomyces ossiformis]|uniref:Uncharacterized protein n=1 Tax=Apophysomyces ossiformis TaxID=679940 RepID=A0A8H7EUY1_9FUNG|nr:hypothetical protein EC973_004047 [Apophysomyces ossiformis]
MVAHGGIDALIWLCRSSTSKELHHLITTILAMLSEKESIRPVIITKWALPPLMQLIKFYTQPEFSKRVDKKSPVASIHSSITAASSNSSTIPPFESDGEGQQNVILEIVINCTHVLYQLSRAGMFNQKETMSDGVLETLLMLATYELDMSMIEGMVSVEKAEGKPTADDTQYQEQLKERISIVQSLAAKAISAISASAPNQPSVIEQMQGTCKLAQMLRSQNEEVRKYIAKTVAYLSLRNDKYKSSLLSGDGARALVSIIACLPQADDGGDEEKRRSDLDYYLSSKENDVKSEEHTARLSQIGTQSETSLNAAAVSHTCCALANFATNMESQLQLMSQPRLLKYICNIPAAFPTHTEIHRHVARCLANFALYEENNSLMLSDKQTNDNDHKDAYNVISTLLAMGQSANVTSDVQRQIVRAIDNLSSHAPTSNGASKWHSLFKDAYPYILRVLETSKDEDTVKRAESIRERARLEEKEDMPSSTEDEEEVEADTKPEKLQKKNRKKKGRNKN